MRENHNKTEINHKNTCPWQKQNWTKISTNLVEFSKRKISCAIFVPVTPEKFYLNSFWLNDIFKLKNTFARETLLLN